MSNNGSSANQNGCECVDRVGHVSDSSYFDASLRNTRAAAFLQGQSSAAWFGCVGRSQLLFISLFFWLLAATAFRGTFTCQGHRTGAAPWPVESFLLADPYVAAMTLLSTHTLYRGLALAGVVMALTLVFGRVFCGWICPFGTLHHFFGWIFPNRYLRGGKRVSANRTHSWQITKYYLLLAFLGAALFGSAIGGLLDPICVAVRAIGLGVLPVLQYIAIRTTDIVATTHVRAIQAASDSIQEQLAQTCGPSNQAYYHQTWLIVFLLIAILIHESHHSSLLVSRALPARCISRGLFAVRPVRHEERPCQVHGLQSMPSALSSCRQPAGGREAPTRRMPRMPELRVRLPRRCHQVGIFTQPSFVDASSQLAAKDHGRVGRGRGGGLARDAHRQLARQGLQRKGDSARQEPSKNVISSTGAFAAPNA